MLAAPWLFCRVMLETRWLIINMPLELHKQIYDCLFLCQRVINSGDLAAVRRQLAQFESDGLGRSDTCHRSLGAVRARYVSSDPRWKARL